VLRIHLTDDQRSELHALRRSDLPPAARDRLEMVLLSDAGWSAPGPNAAVRACWKSATRGWRAWGPWGARFRRAATGAALGGVLDYFAGHQVRLRCALRPRRGQAIGSGLVEGSIKRLRNRRLKYTTARWKVAHVGPFVELGVLANGPEWDAWRN
jgi:hypothetical protein